MKHSLRSVLLFFCTGTLLFGQNKLSNSAQSGHYTYIYKLTDQEAFIIASSGKKAVNEGFLHTVIDSFYHSRPYLKKLPYGNYLQVHALKLVMD